MTAITLLAALASGSIAFAATPAATTASPDAQVSAMVQTANDAEIEAGKVAETKATNAQVKAFAKHMVEEHTANNKQVTTIDKELNVTAQPNDKVAEMKKENAQKLAEVTRHTGKDFDKAYIELQVAMHEQVLAQIETALLPTAQNPAMKTFLETTKTHVQQHLAQAKKLQSSLK